MIRITQRKVSPQRNSAILAFHIDRPNPGTTLDTYDLQVDGWLLPTQESVVEVHAIHCGTLLSKAPVELPRPDVARKFQDYPRAPRTGFSMRVSLLGLPLEFELRLVAVIAGHHPIPIATLRGNRSALSGEVQSKLQPVMVTMQGRVGSTWLMRLLAEHPAIVVNPPHFEDPYETRIASYWLHMVKVLSEPADHNASSSRVDFTAKKRWIGHNPFYTPAMLRLQGMENWFGRMYPKRLAAFCQGSIDAYYMAIADACDKDNPVFFAEKFHADHIPWIAWELYPNAREIILVRDFRDMVTSILAFNRKRGYNAFGRERARTDLAYVESLRNNVMNFKRTWELRSDRAFLLRYEDLVLHPEVTLEKVLTYLGAPADVEMMLRRAKGEASASLEDHRTTHEVTASIGRWKKDLEPEMQSACSRAFEDALVAFGYA